MNRSANRLFASSGIVVVFFALQGCDRATNERQNRSSSSSSSVTSSGALSPEAIITRKFLEIETQRNHLDQTVWSNELVAQKHEQVFVELWDQLRKARDKFSVLDNFRFGELILRKIGPPENLERGISRVRFSGPAQSLGTNEWQSLVTKLKEDGFQLDQSEWRHPQFQLSSNGATSVIVMTLHVARPKTQERFVVRGNLLVQWQENRGSNASPFPKRIEVTDLELLQREGARAFDNVLNKDITPDPNANSTDPMLIVYDLNQDGLSEIILATRNLVYWNRSQGQFSAAALCEHPPESILTGVIADFDGDAIADFLCADHSGVLHYSGDRDGKFAQAPKRTRFRANQLLNPFVLTAGDIDRDGDLDIWLAQYKVPYLAGQMPTPYYDANDGFPSFLLTNDGDGTFQDRTEAAGLAAMRFRRTYSSSFVDLDNDADLDLVVVSDFAGADVYLNDGAGRYAEATSKLLDEPHAFGMAHTFGDYDGDGQLDLFVIGMNSFVAQRLDSLHLGPPDFREHQRMRTRMAYGNRLYFQRNGRFQQTAMSDQTARSGWSWGATSADFDNDGDVDIYVVNGHKSRETAKDYESQFWRHDIYAATSEHDPALDLYFRSVGTKLYGAGLSYGGYDKNRFFLNRSGNEFVEVGHLMGVAMERDCRNLVSDDLDGDGKLDLIVTTYEVWPNARQGLHLFQNRSDENANWIGFRLREASSGHSAIGAKIFLEFPGGRALRHLVTGDSYRSQHSATAHFGLGSLSQVTRVKIEWPDRRTTEVHNPVINRYHNIDSVAHSAAKQSVSRNRFPDR